MSTQPRLSRSIPYWVLVAGSVVSAAAGTGIVLTTTSAMSQAILGGTATGVEVYAGQSWAVLGGGLVTAGAVGLALALALAAAKSLRPAPATAEEAADSSAEPAEGSDEVATEYGAAADLLGATAGSEHADTAARQEEAGAEHTGQERADTEASEAQAPEAEAPVAASRASRR